MIVTNCPAITDIMNYEIVNDDFFETGVDTPNYCIKYKKQCKEINDCIIKQKGDLKYEQ